MCELYLTDGEALEYRILAKEGIDIGNGYTRCISDKEEYKDYYFEVKWLGDIKAKIQWHIKKIRKNV